MKERKHEKIGGGFVVMRRGKRTGRISVRPGKPPFEHPSRDSAEIEAMRLAEANPGETYVIMEQVRGFAAHVNPAPKKETA